MISCQAKIQIVLLIITCLISTGSNFNLFLMLTLQDLLQVSPCDPSDNITVVKANCCDLCLGLSIVEYNLILAVGYWINILVVFISGYMIDRFGLHRVTVTIAVLLPVGATIQFLGAFFFNIHGLMLWLLATSRAIIHSCQGAQIVIRLCIANEYFPERYRAFCISLTFSFATGSAALSSFVVSTYAEWYGVQATFLLCVWISVVGMLPSFAFATMYKTLNALSCYLQCKGSAQPKSRLIDRCFHQINLKVILIVLVAALAIGIIEGFLVNLINLLEQYFNVAAADAVNYFLSLYVFVTVFFPLTGAVTGVLSVSRFMATSGYCLYCCGFLMMAIASKIHPLISLLIVVTGSVFAVTSSLSLSGNYSSPTTLGTIQSVIRALASLFAGVFGAINGALVQRAENISSGWRDNILMYAFISTISLGLFVVFCISERTKCNKLSEIGSNHAVRNADQLEEVEIHLLDEEER